jgi:hypothetical protein
MESGLVQLVVTLLRRIHRKLGQPPLEQLIEYVLNNAAAWEFPELAGEAAEVQERERTLWRNHLAWLDTAILSLLGEQQIAEADIAAALDEILASSLWDRRLVRHTAEGRQAITSGLLGRAKHLWANSTAPQRRGYFLAGVGLNTGSALDQIAPSANELLVDANAAIHNHEDDAAIEALTKLADKLFAIPPFTPDDLPANWQEILRLWLLGLPIGPAITGHEAEGLQFVEGGLVYRPPWAMEAVRVRGIANGDVVWGLSFDFFELRLAVAAVETGTLNRPATILIQAGFSSRLAAIKAAQETSAEFSSAFELRLWLDSPEVAAITDQGNWPTRETTEMWRSFRASFSPVASRAWSEHRFSAQVAWRTGYVPPAGHPVRLYSHPETGAALVLSESAELLGQVRASLNSRRQGLARASVHEDQRGILISYLGPNDLWVG